MNMKSYRLYIELPDGQGRHHLGTLPATNRAELEVCMMSCVSLLCGLQNSTARPMFTLHEKSPFGYTSTLAVLTSHTQDWGTESGEPFTVEAL
ncbi:hypothetical protein [Ideonella paludis]|uniref:Uncharacterized protein n=1 Tax=Ideonella paludis TaxID=1233411 RepID=A0ABS5E004_9BURK|nr:hypothetical protein [Ideonella paludis]MBQ0936718.1 hypothetical protein [Ideonella paludis]